MPAQAAANGDLQKIEKRDAKVKARREQAAADEAELLGMPQQPAAGRNQNGGAGSNSTAAMNCMVMS